MSNPSFAPLATMSRPRRRRLQPSFAVIALLIALGTVPTGVARADDLQDVSKLVANGRLDDAEKRADAFLAKTPRDAQMRFLKGVILAQRGKRDEAVALFVAITQDYPELPEPYNNLAVIYAARGEYDNARTALETAIRVSPNYATAHENLGDVYAALAARAYQDARRHDAGNASALRKLDATRALLTTAPTSASTTSSAPAPVVVAASPAPTVAQRSQRNVGLPYPAGPSIIGGNAGASAPEIIVPASATAVPSGSNVVGVETLQAAEERTSTAPLAGARTIVAADAAQPIDAVTAAVRAWTGARSTTAGDLRIRVDGDTAVARFRESAPRAASRALDLKRSGTAWTVVGERTDP